MPPVIIHYKFVCFSVGSCDLSSFSSLSLCCHLSGNFAFLYGHQLALIKNESVKIHHLISIWIMNVNFKKQALQINYQFIYRNSKHFDYRAVFLPSLPYLSFLHITIALPCLSAQLTVHNWPCKTAITVLSLLD